MKFVVKLIDAAGVPGGKAYALCDAETGEALPAQKRCKVDNGVGEIGTVTVEFRIDGRDVSLA
jgi:hypothetical protein